jgi:ABC-type branched-subunit amino acid transport system permease subunit
MNIRPSFKSTEVAIVLTAIVLVASASVMPAWMEFLLTLGLAKALVVLGVVLQMRAGLVSFGQGLFYCVGGYTVGLGAQYVGVNDALLLLIIAGAAGTILAGVCGLLLTRYREIFFAMLTMALSMILYGILVKSLALGSTDGFNVMPPTFFGWAPSGDARKQALYVMTIIVAAMSAIAFHRYMVSSLGRVIEGVRENEIRVEYLGLSPRTMLHRNYVFAAAISSLGGALTAMATGHVDADMAFWTTSGEFVFMAILGGTGHVAAPFIAAIVFSVIRTFAIQEAPNTWQMVLGIVLLALILFLPKGLWSLVNRRPKGVEA